MISMRLPYDLFLQCPGWGGHVPSPPWIGYCCVPHCKRYVFFGTGFMGKKTRTFTISVRFRLYSFGVLGPLPFTHSVVRCDLDFYPFSGRSDSDFACLCIFLLFSVGDATDNLWY